MHFDCADYCATYMGGGFVNQDLLRARDCQQANYESILHGLCCTSSNLIFQIVKLFASAQSACLLEHGFSQEILFVRKSKILLTQKLVFLVFEFFYVTFFASLFLENRILWFFIYFQKTTPFEMLDVKKSEYQKTEKRLMKSVKRAMILIAAISLTFFFFHFG